MSGISIGKPAAGMAHPALVRSLGSEQIASYLEHERIYAAYAIGELGAGRRCQSLVQETMHPALCLHFKYSSPSFLLTVGDSRGLAAILESGLTPWRGYLVYRPEHAPAVESLYRVSSKLLMRRMCVTADRFQDVDLEAMRLTASDTSRINRLYLVDMSSNLMPSQVERGVYYGVSYRGRLVSVAGTHFISRRQGIAAVGNVFTHPRHRGFGYASACVAAVTRELFHSCRDVVLNVMAGNDTAFDVYQRLGYREHCQFFEASGTLKLKHLVGRLARRFL